MSGIRGIFLLLLTLTSSWAHAQFDLSAFDAAENLLSDTLTKAMIQTVGLGVDHRAYEGASPMSTYGIGLDISVEATLFSLPDSFKSALSDAGFSGINNIPSLPVPRVHIHKSLGSRFDIGVSAVAYTSYLLAGGDMKLALSVPKEGFMSALRLSYTYGKLGFISTNTITPAILFGKRLSFADPYLGAAYQYTWGKVTVPIDFFAEVPPELVGLVEDPSNSASGGGILLFGGVGLRAGPTGLKLTIELAYSSVGVNTLGMKFGLRF